MKRGRIRSFNVWNERRKQRVMVFIISTEKSVMQHSSYVSEHKENKKQKNKCSWKRNVHALLIGIYFTITQKAETWIITWSSQPTSECISTDHGVSLSGGYALLANWHPGRRNLNWAIASIRLVSGHVCVASAWLIIDVGGPSPMWVELPRAGGFKLCKRIGWGSHGEQSNNQNSSMASGSSSVPRIRPWLL